MTATSLQIFLFLLLFSFLAVGQITYTPRVYSLFRQSYSCAFKSEDGSLFVEFSGMWQSLGPHKSISFCFGNNDISISEYDVSYDSYVNEIEVVVYRSFSGIASYLRMNVTFENYEYHSFHIYCDEDTNLFFYNWEESLARSAEVCDAIKTKAPWTVPGAPGVYPSRSVTTPPPYSPPYYTPQYFPPTHSNGDGNETDLALPLRYVILISGLGFLFIFSCLAALLRRRRRCKQRQENGTEMVDMANPVVYEAQPIPQVQTVVNNAYPASPMVNMTTIQPASFGYTMTNQ